MKILVYVVVDKVLLLVYSPVINTYATSRNIIYAFRVVISLQKDYIPHGINWLSFLMDTYSLLCEVVATFFHRLDERQSLVNVKDWRDDGC